MACIDSTPTTETMEETTTAKANITTSVEDTLIASITNFPYNLDKPDQEFKLPNKLKEISGLGIDSTDQYLYAVQDEEGILFVINKETVELENQYKFYKEGDYEGIECVGDKVYIVKSTGTIYEVRDVGKETQKRKKHKFGFSKSSDVEGLGYDPVTNSLLLSCKGKAMRGEEAKLKKGIYGLSLDSLEMDSIPRYTVSLESVKAFLETNTTLEYFDKLVKVFKPEEEFVFGPAGIAVHPITNEIYVVSAVGNVLLVLNRANEIMHLQKLRKKIHAQPEGIVFDQKGNLYISNEGKSNKARIYKFGYKEL